jgi:hypothetical protein
MAIEITFQMGDPESPVYFKITAETPETAVEQLQETIQAMQSPAEKVAPPQLPPASSSGGFKPPTIQ